MNRAINIVFPILTFVLSSVPSALLAADNLGPMTPMTGLHNAEFVDFESEFVDEKFSIFVAAPTFVDADNVAQITASGVLHAGGCSTTSRLAISPQIVGVHSLSP